MKLSKSISIVKEKEYFKTGIQGSYPKLHCYANDNQYDPEREIEPEIQDQGRNQEPEDQSEFASMIVNCSRKDSCETPKFDNLMVIIDGYMAYMKLHDHQATEVNYKPIAKISPSMVKELNRHFHFGMLLFKKRLFSKLTIPKSIKYRVEKYYARFDPDLEKICNKQLKVLCEMNELMFLDELESAGYITNSG